jgi:Zn-dependent M28 family amino/carboxypeptidase
MMNMPGRSYAGALPQLTGEQAGLRDRLRAHVEELAGQIGQRNYATPQSYTAAADYISRSFRSAGYEPATRDGWKPQDTLFANIEVEIPGTKHPDQILVIGAHYDTVLNSPGADDNASGVAALLEIARSCAGRRFDRTVRFVAFYNEEGIAPGPFGSVQYADACKGRDENIVGMISLEMLGCFSDAPKSQQYPFPFNLFYPSTANFIAFVGNYDSRQFVHETIRSFRRHAQFPSKGVAAPNSIRDAGRSDHAAFWRNGYQGLMITDTANFRYAHYHKPTDTPEMLDYDAMGRVTDALMRVVQDLATARGD